MNVLTAPLARSTQAPPAPPAQEHKDLKPLTERWSVDGQNETFSSTSALVSQGEALNGKRATYTFKEEPDKAPFSMGEKLANAVGSGLQSAAIGAGAGAAIGVVCSVLAGVGDIMGGLMGGRMSGVSNLVLLVPVLGGAGIGAVGGGVNGFKAEPTAVESSINGTLQTRDGKVLFYPGGQVDKEVNLTEFQSAGEAPLVQAEDVKSNAAWNTVKGAAAGAAVVPAIFIPLAGLAAGGYAGYRAGAALDKRTELGRGVGLTLGLAATAGTIVIGQLDGGRLQAMGALAGGLGVLGGAIGNAVFTAEGKSEAKHEYGTQWWNQDRPTGETGPRG